MLKQIWLCSALLSPCREIRKPTGRLSRIVKSISYRIHNCTSRKIATLFSLVLHSGFYLIYNNELIAFIKSLSQVQAHIRPGFWFLAGDAICRAWAELLHCSYWLVYYKCQLYRRCVWSYKLGRGLSVNETRLSVWKLWVKLILDRLK